MRIAMVHFHKTRLPPIHYKSRTRTENRQTTKFRFLPVKMLFLEVEFQKQHILINDSIHLRMIKKKKNNQILSYPGLCKTLISSISLSSQ